MNNTICRSKYVIARFNFLKGHQDTCRALNTCGPPEPFNKKNRERQKKCKLIDNHHTMWRADLMLWKLNNIFYGSICEINSDHMYDMYDIALKIPSKMRHFQECIEEIKKLLCRDAPRPKSLRDMVISRVDGNTTVLYDLDVLEKNEIIGKLSPTDFVMR